MMRAGGRARSVFPWETPDSTWIRRSFTVRGPVDLEIAPGDECPEAEFGVVSGTLGADYSRVWDEARDLVYVTTRVAGVPFLTGRFHSEIVDLFFAPGFLASPGLLMFAGEWKPQIGRGVHQLVDVWAELSGAGAESLRAIDSAIEPRYSVTVRRGPGGRAFVRVGENMVRVGDPEDVQAMCLREGVEEGKRFFVDSLHEGLESHVRAMFYDRIGEHVCRLLESIEGIGGEVPAREEVDRVEGGLRVWHDQTEAMTTALVQKKKMLRWGEWVRLVGGEWSQSPSHSGDTTFEIARSEDGVHWGLKHREAFGKIVLVAELMDRRLSEREICTRMVAEYVAVGGCLMHDVMEWNEDLFDVDAFFDEY